VSPFLWRTTAERLIALGSSLTMRGGEETPYITDNGNLILDLMFEDGIVDPSGLATAIKATTGVVEHGLFIGMADTCIVAGSDGPRMLGRSSGAG
jgi:ribose 5-phosphate isomerase A